MSDEGGPMRFNSPVSTEKVGRLLARAELQPGQRVVDAGCGTGEFLIRAVEAAGCEGLGLDRDEELLVEARRRAGDRLPPGRCAFRQADLTAGVPDPGPFDLALCVGSTHAFAMGDGAYAAALAGLRRVVRPGGLLLVGEGYWKRAPDAGYLELLGEPTGITRDHAGNVAFAVDQGLVPLYAAVSSDDEWDDFEWSHRARIEREAAARPDDPDLAKRLAASRAWRDGYLRWGRDTMGFGFYLFQVPGLQDHHAPSGG